MNVKRSALAVLFVFALAGLARAQTTELVGKVLDADGKPIMGAEVAATNTVFKDRVCKGTSDKKGNFLVPGLLFAAQAQNWSISAKAEGYVPVSVNIVARDSQKVLYFSGDNKLSAANPSTELQVRGFADIRIEFRMEPGDASAPPPVAAAGAPAAGAAPDAYAEAVEKARSGDVEGSVDLFKKAIDEKPDEWERHDTFAKVLLKLDRQGEATIQANKAVQLAPDKAAPLITLTDIYIARSLQDKAADAIARAEKIEPDNTRVLERASAVAASNGKLDEAIALSERVVAAQPTNTEMMVTLAALYNRNKQPKKAEDVLNKVVALDPANAHRTFYNVGVVIENNDDAKESDHKKAIDAFKKAIDLKPDYAIAYRDLGFAYLRLGDLMAARKALQKYVDLDPKAKDAPEIKATVKSLDSAK